jgi:hypothetical protein
MDNNTTPSQTLTETEHTVEVDGTLIRRRDWWNDRFAGDVRKNGGSVATWQRIIHNDLKEAGLL